jgi:ABC-type nitrate/sulfonate/bicarbonate transport system substrate-binding protein
MVSLPPLLLTAVLMIMPSVQVEKLKRIRLGLEWFMNADHMPLVVALREGFFCKACPDVENSQTRRSLRGGGAGDHHW